LKFDTEGKKNAHMKEVHSKEFLKGEKKVSLR
jgi:hypothetical protein